MIDDNLTLRAKSGDPEALARLLRQSQPDLRRFASRVCRSSEDADDAVQHAMLTITLQLGAFRGLSRFSTWIFTVIRNECQRYARVARRWVSRDDRQVEPADSAPTPDVTLENSQALQMLVTAIRDLQPELRRVFVLRELEGLSTAACAAELGLSEPNVKVRLHRARQLLRAALENYPVDSPA